MYAVLGDFKFEGYKGFQELVSSDETVLAEHPRIEGKPRLQAVGEKLREIQIKILLHSSFCDPEADIEVLQSYRRNAEVIAFVAGDGTPFGNFVVKSITNSYEQTDNFGRIISTTLEVNLIEAILADGSAKLKDKKLATELPKLNPIALPKRPSDPQKIAKELKIININSDTMHKELTLAQKITSKTTSTFRLAKERIGKIKKSLQVIESVGTSTRNVVGMYDSILGNVQSVKGATEALSVFVEAGDINSSVNASAQLRTTFDSLYVSSSPINNLVAQRKEAEPSIPGGTEFDFIFNGTF